MNHLLRELAPLSDDAWAQVDDEAKSHLTTYLAARRLVDFTGPSGWKHSSHNLGTSVEIETPAKVSGVEVRARQVLALVELRVPFALARAELGDAGRGNDDIDLDPLSQASAAIALAENLAVFHGYPAASITGITEASAHEPVTVTGGVDDYSKHVATGVERLMLAGVSGPYGLALGSDVWTAVVETTEHGGYPLFNHLARIVGGPIVWAPGVEGGVVISQRGGDFLIDCGQDLSLGYSHHDASTVTLYLEESFTFRVLGDEAAVALHS